MGWLQAFNATVLALTAQLLVGWMALVVLDAATRGRGRSPCERACARRSLSRAAPLAAAAGAAAALLQWRQFGWGWHAVEPVGAFIPGLFTLAGAGVASGCWVALDAGRLEARGLLRIARAQLRCAGQVTCASSGLMLAVVFPAWLAAPSPSPGGGAVALGGLGVAVTGVVTLLAGLARKPRPSAQLAAVVYVLALLLLAAADARDGAPAAATLSWFG